MEDDTHLVRIMLVENKKAVTRNWGRTAEKKIYTIEKLTCNLRLREAQLDKKTEKMDNLQNSDWRRVNGLAKKRETVD